MQNKEKIKTLNINVIGAANVIQLPSIAGVEITTDEAGRFNLNALHKASGLGKAKQPNNWLRLDSTKELISEFSNSSDMRSLPISVSTGRDGGTFSVEQLAVAYANWISPKFYLQVINTFLDFKSGKHHPVQPQKELTRYELLKVALQAEEEKLQLEHQVEKMAPTVEAFNRIANSDASMCVRDAAKSLQLRPIDLTAWLSQHHWIYRRPGCQSWIGYQDKIQSGLIEHKVATVQRIDGSDKTVEQVRLTAKGLVKISTLINQEAA